MVFQKELIRRLQSGGGRTAIEQGDKSISYAQLLDEANSVTAYLLDKKWPAQTVTGILLEDRREMITTMIGVINAGGVFIFLDAGLPAARMAAIREALKLEHVIVRDPAALPEALRGSTVHVYPEMLLTRAGDIVYPECSGEDSLYVYFTSGTTGTPKGIVGKNKSLLQFLQWEIAEFDVTNGSRFSQFISPYFDAFLRDVFAPLFANGVICIPPTEEDLFTSEKLTRWIDEHKVTHIHCVPSLFWIINHDRLREQHFGSLQYVLLSGEKIQPSGLAGWYRVFGDGIQLVNLYGPTETTMIRSSYRIQPADVEKTRIPIGKPIAETDFLVAGKDLKACGISVAGDLYILTDYLTKGYLNASPSDQERFMETEYGGRLRKGFRTGDKARKLPGGNFELLGREDRQIKLRGIRVELDEIETVLCHAPEVKQVAVIQHEDNLAAFVIRDRTGEDAAVYYAMLEAYLKQRLPTYMIPATIVGVAGFPLLPNGKINYQALAATLKAAEREIVLPVNTIEDQLLAIWTEILGDKPVSTEDSFHTIGGNSLGMMRLIGKIYKHFGVRMSLSQLLGNLTIKRQAGLIRQGAKDKIMVIEKAKPRGLYRLSAAQERIYYHYKLDTASTAYNLPMAWEIHQGDVRTIETTLSKLIRRQESLRTQFVFEGNQLFQSVREEVKFNMTQLYCGDSPEQVRQALSGFIRPFDLSQAPLFRAAIIFAGEKRRILIVDTHHIVCDGMSQVNLLSEFIRLQRGEELAPLKIQYKDYAEWERNFKQSSDYLAHREFWLKSFEGGIPKLQWPVNKEERIGPDTRGASIDFSVENRVMLPINEALKANGITEFSGMFAIYFLFLSQITGQDDIVIGTNTSGRVQEETMGLVGMFAKTLPIRLQLESDISFLDFVGVVHRQLIEANSHQLYDLADIAGDLKAKDLKTSADLFSAMLVFQNFEIERGEVEGLQFSGFEIDSNTSKYPLSLFVSFSERAIRFRFEYSTRSFSRYDMEILTEKFQKLIEALSKKTDRKVIDYWELETEVAPMREDITFNF